VLEDLDELVEVELVDGVWVELVLEDWLELVEDELVDGV